MPSTATDRLQGLTTSVAVKAPCVVAATANLTLSGEQTVAGVAVTTGQRVLAAAQTDATQRLIYVVDTGPWALAQDSDGVNDLVSGTQVLCGTADPDAWEYLICRANVDVIVPGETALTWERLDPVTLALQASLASTSDAAEGAGMLGALYSLNYTARTIGAAVFDGAINLLWLLTEAQRAAVKAKTYADDHTSILAAALTYGNGRAIYMPTGGWKIGASTLNKAGLHLFGDGWGNTIIRSGDATVNTFTVTADNVTISDLEMQGAATSATNTKFAIFTDVATPVVGLKVLRVKISGQAGTHGFTNGVKFDDGCHYGAVEGCYIERLWGSASGYGYGVLSGNCNDLRVLSNWMLGSAGRGRHGVYFSAGANGCVAAFNKIDGFEWDGIAIYSQGIQPPCTDNVITMNRVTGCATIAGSSNAGISVAGHALRNTITQNKIISSGSCGIVVLGTGFTDCKDTTIDGNDIINSAFQGVELVAAVGGTLRGNYIKDSGQASAGTYANVRFISDATTATSDWTVDGNRIPASATARSAFQTNATAPTPSDLKFDSNKVGAGTSADYEWAGSTFAVDGYIRFSQAHNPASVAGGASEAAASFTVTGAAVGDSVKVWHSNDAGGMYWHGKVSALNTVQVWWGNVTGGAIDPANGTIYIDVFKRSP